MEYINKLGQTSILWKIQNVLKQFLTKSVKYDTHQILLFLNLSFSPAINYTGVIVFIGK